MLTNFKRRTKYLLIKLLRIKDNAHSVAIGFTIGSLMNFIPSFGIGPLLSTTLPRLFRGNAVAGLVGGVLLIWTFPILFYLNIVIGNLLFPIPIEEFNLDNGIEDTEEVIDAGVTIGKSFLLGMAVNMLVFGIVIYIVVFNIIKKYRIKLLHRIYSNWLIPRKK